MGTVLCNFFSQSQHPENIALQRGETHLGMKQQKKV